MFHQVQAELYQRLQNFKLDDPTHEFGFTRHLIKNHGWTEFYAIKAIAEYKKFAFLTVVADHQVVPCDAVDQVWHAHVLLTQSYWEEFCPKILQKKLHHHPARGGKTERAEFHHLYTQTVDSYRRYFGNPPQDIWSPPDIRFGKELKMQRISTTDNYIIQTAYLAGGDQRAIESAIVKLVHQKYLRPNVKNRTFAIAKYLEPEADYLEHQVMDRVRWTPEFKKLKRTNCYQISYLKRQLEQSKLIIKQNSAIVVRSRLGYFITLFIIMFLVGNPLWV
jgi:hypothetical protein